MELKLEVAQISTLNLKADDTLVVKLIGDYMGDQDMYSLKSQLKAMFPKNKVLIFAMPNGSDIVFEKVEPQTDLSCSEEPKGYCDDCECGKKEASLQSI